MMFFFFYKKKPEIYDVGIFTWNWIHIICLYVSCSSLSFTHCSVFPLFFFQFHLDLNFCFGDITACSVVSL